MGEEGPAKTCGGGRKASLRVPRGHITHHHPSNQLAHHPPPGRLCHGALAALGWMGCGSSGKGPGINSCVGEWERG